MRLWWPEPCRELSTLKFSKFSFFVCSFEIHEYNYSLTGGVCGQHDVIPCRDHVHLDSVEELPPRSQHTVLCKVCKKYISIT